MKTRNLFAFLLATIIVGFSLTFQSCPPPPNDVPSISQTIVAGIDTESVQLNWEGVDGAKGYRIIIADSISGRILIDTNVTAQKNYFTLSGLSNKAVYKSEITSIGQNESPNRNSIKTFFSPPDTNLIFEDVVVMRGDYVLPSAGMNNCNCPDSGWSDALGEGIHDWTSILGNSNGRRVFMFRFIVGTTDSIEFKVGFSTGDPVCNLIKARSCSSEGMLNEIGEYNNNMSLEIGLNGYTATIQSSKPSKFKRELWIDFENICSGCSIRFKECEFVSGVDCFH